MSQPIKLQLSREALIHIFEEDPTFRLELQTAVVQQFVRTHLRGLLTSDFFEEQKRELAAVVQALKDEIGAEMRDTLAVTKKDRYGKVTIEAWTAEARAFIRDVLTTQREQAVMTMLEDSHYNIDPDLIREALSAEYKRQIRVQVREEIMAEIKAKLSA